MNQDITLWNISPKHTFIVVMSPKGQLAETRRKYYKLGEDRYRKLYEKKLKQLNEALKIKQLTESEFHKKLEEANLQLQQAMEKLDDFCDKFARINRDMLTELDQKALDLLDHGNIEGAIKVYEDAQLLDIFKQTVQQRDSLHLEKTFVRSKLLEEIQLLEKKGNNASLSRKDSLVNILER